MWVCYFASSHLQSFHRSSNHHWKNLDIIIKFMISCLKNKYVSNCIAWIVLNLIEFLPIHHCFNEKSMIPFFWSNLALVELTYQNSQWQIRNVKCQKDCFSEVFSKQMLQLTLRITNDNPTYYQAQSNPCSTLSIIFWSVNPVRCYFCPSLHPFFNETLFPNPLEMSKRP